MNKNPRYTDLTNIANILGELGINWVTPPQEVNSSGTPGDIAYDGNFLYLCVANNTWRRITLNSWVS